jgi:hypothetical protein
MKYSGIDLHSNNCLATVTDEEDRVVAGKRRLQREPVRDWSRNLQQLRFCEKPLGHAVAPTFFWGGQAARARDGYLVVRFLMGVWRDSSQL